jgi:hypothetical protein
MPNPLENKTTHHKPNLFQVRAYLTLERKKKHTGGITAKKNITNECP